MERKRTASLVFLKVLTILVSAGLIALFFLSKTESRDSLFDQYVDFFKTMFRDKGAFDARTYIYALAPLVAVLVNVIFSLCFLFAKGKRAGHAYVTVYGITTALAFLSFFRDVNTIGLVFATNNVTLSPKTLKELKILWEYSVFGKIYGILLIGLIVGGCLAAHGKAEKKNAALKVFTTLLGLLSLTATLFPVFKNSAVNAQNGFFLTFPSGAKDAVIDFTGMTKSAAIAGVGKWIYFAVPALVAFNLFWTHLAFGAKRSQGFDAALHIIAIIVVLCAFLFPLCFLTKSAKADMKPLFGICYGILLGVSLLCTILSIAVGKSIKKFAVAETVTAANTENLPAYQELSAEEAAPAPAEASAPAAEPETQNSRVVLGESDFEIGKQMPSGGPSAEFDADHEALRPSFVADNIGGAATENTAGAAFHTSADDRSGAGYRPETAYRPAKNDTVYGDVLPDVFGAASSHDAFLVTLTAREKAEFKKLFVDDSPLRSSRLPAYVPGGDNREFFRRVFIYIGRFRSVISPALLQKIYTFSSLNG